MFNFEYRIPIFGPVTLVPFFDAGMNRILYTNQLTVNPGQIANLNAQFPQAAFTNKVKIAPGTQDTRMSTGLEIDVVLPIVQAPFRVYYAYNPSVVREYLQPPIVVDRSMFPNNDDVPECAFSPTGRRIRCLRSAGRSGLPSAGHFRKALKLV